MSETQKAKPAKGRILKYSADDLLRAYCAVIDDKISLKRASRIFNIPLTSLGDRVRGQRPLVPRERTFLSQEEESLVMRWINRMALGGVPQTKQGILRMVQQMLNADNRVSSFPNNKPGNTWWLSFLKRHPGLLICRSPQGPGQGNATVTEDSLRVWFLDAQATILRETGVDIQAVNPDHIFCSDESGFAFHAKSGVVIPSSYTSKYKSKKAKLGSELNSDTDGQITILACGSAGGALMPPFVIYPCQRMKFNPRHSFAKSSTGRIDSGIYKRWFEDSFIPFTKDLPKPVFLFVDGHAAFISLEIHRLCEANGIVYVVLPPLACHALQPLDLLHFKNECLSDLTDFQNIERESITRESFSLIFQDSWKRVYESEPGRLMTAFEAAGLSPWGPDRVDFSKFLSRLPVPFSSNLLQVQSFSSTLLTSDQPSSTFISTLTKVEPSSSSIPTLTKVELCCSPTLTSVQPSSSPTLTSVQPSSSSIPTLTKVEPSSSPTPTEVQPFPTYIVTMTSPPSFSMSTLTKDQPSTNLILKRTKPSSSPTTEEIQPASSSTTTVVQSSFSSNLSVFVKVRPKDILVLQTGGTIDKRYPQGPGAYAFEFGESAVEKILQRTCPTFQYTMRNICAKDSQDITDNDRKDMLSAIVKSNHSLVLITHGTDTLCETAQYLVKANVGQGSTSESGIGGKTVVLTGAFIPETMKDSDADFNAGFALGFMHSSPAGVFVAMAGSILDGAHVMRLEDGTFVDRRQVEA